MENIALLNADGEVVTIVRGDAPEGWKPPDGLTVCPESQLPEGWQRVDDLAKRPAIQALREAEETGIEIPFGVGSVRMLCGDRDRALFSSALALYRTHEDLLPTEGEKEEFRNSFVTFADANGHPHQITVQQARQLLVVYGATYQAIWAAAAAESAP